MPRSRLRADPPSNLDGLPSLTTKANLMRADAWGILWRSDNRLDGKREHLVGQITAPHGDGHPIVKPAGDAQVTLTFKTKRAAVDFIKARFGYIAKRPDLRAEPHGWKMPVPVRVRITVEQVVN